MITSIVMRLSRYLPAILFYQALQVPAALGSELQTDYLFNLRTATTLTHPQKPDFPQSMHGSYLKVTHEPFRTTNHRLIGWTQNNDWEHVFLAFHPLSASELADLQIPLSSRKLENLGRVAVRYDDNKYDWLNVEFVKSKWQTQEAERGINKESGYPTEFLVVSPDYPGLDGIFGSEKGRLAHFNPGTGLMDQFVLCPIDGGSNMKEWALFKSGYSKPEAKCTKSTQLEIMYSKYTLRVPLSDLFRRSKNADGELIDESAHHSDGGFFLDTIRNYFGKRSFAPMEERSLPAGRFGTEDYADCADKDAACIGYVHTASVDAACVGQNPGFENWATCDGQDASCVKDSPLIDRRPPKDAVVDKREIVHAPCVSESVNHDPPCATLDADYVHQTPPCVTLTVDRTPPCATPPAACVEDTLTVNSDAACANHHAACATETVDRTPTAATQHADWVGRDAPCVTEIVDRTPPCPTQDSACFKDTLLVDRTPPNHAVVIPLNRRSDDGVDRRPPNDAVRHDIDRTPPGHASIEEGKVYEEDKPFPKEDDESLKKPTPTNQCGTETCPSCPYILTTMTVGSAVQTSTVSMNTIWTTARPYREYFDYPGGLGQPPAFDGCTCEGSARGCGRGNIGDRFACRDEYGRMHVKEILEKTGTPYHQLITKDVTSEYWDLN